MRIVIKNTTFGLVENGIVRRKTPNDPPFEVADELGARLIREGVALPVIGCGAEAENTAESIAETAGEAEDSGGNFGIPEYSTESTKAELQSIADEYGIETDRNATKQQLLDALDNFFADALPDTEE